MYVLGVDLLVLLEQFGERAHHALEVVARDVHAGCFDLGRDGGCARRIFGGHQTLDL